MTIESPLASTTSSRSSPVQKSDRENDESAHVHEEDWSEFMESNNFFNSNEHVTDNANSSFFGFSSHDDCRQIRLPASSSPSAPSNLTIYCASSLSPLDMMNLSTGADDATGHLIWMGALLLIESLLLRLPKGRSIQEEYFDKKSIIELGCGTGAAGIAASLVCRPEVTVLTDGNEAALNLVRHNCRVNGLNPRSTREELRERLEADPSCDFQRESGGGSECLSNFCYVFPLKWGSSTAMSEERDGKRQTSKANIADEPCGVEETLPESLEGSFDTVIATDVLYDFDALTPLLETTAFLLKKDGIFLLSHVPRAALPPTEENDHQVSAFTAELLSPFEEYIVRKATSCRNAVLRLERIIRPTELMNAKCDNHYHSESDDCVDHQRDKDRQMTLEDMRDAGAALLVFSRSH